MREPTWIALDNVHCVVLLCTMSRLNNDSKQWCKIIIIISDLFTHNTPLSETRLSSRHLLSRIIIYRFIDNKYYILIILQNMNNIFIPFFLNNLFNILLKNYKIYAAHCKFKTRVITMMSQPNCIEVLLLYQLLLILLLQLL